MMVEYSILSGKGKRMLQVMKRRNAVIKMANKRFEILI
jgi:hypothetical protein